MATDVMDNKSIQTHKNKVKSLLLSATIANFFGFGCIAYMIYMKIQAHGYVVDISLVMTLVGFTLAACAIVRLLRGYADYLKINRSSAQSLSILQAFGSKSAEKISYSNIINILQTSTRAIQFSFIFIFVSSMIEMSR